MRELHVVATSEDGRHVVLATSKKASTGDFRVALDDRLEAAVRGDLPRPGETQPAVVTPKEIQARLRAGESPEEIAASAGVPVSKIDRYAGPVLSERERVISQARAGTVSRSRLGESALPLGEAVDRHLSLTTGVRMETVQWSTRREETGSWLVELSYVSQARRRTAAWRYDIARREVTATDSASAALAHVEPGRRSRAAEPEAFSAAPARGASRKTARRAAPVRAPKPAAASVARTVAARPAPPVRAAAPVPKAPAPAKAAQTAATRAAAARAAGASTARAAAQERAAKAAAAEAARAAAAAKKAADAQAKADKARAAKEAADEAARARAAAKKAEKAAKDKAAREKAAAEKAAKAQAARDAEAARQAELAEQEAAKARAEAEAAAQAEAEAAAQAEAEAAAQAEAEAAAQAEAARVAESAPTGPPTLRVVGSDDSAEPTRRGAKQPPAAARTAPARAAGQRASVPGWADVLLSTAPVARPVDPDPDAD